MNKKLLAVAVVGALASPAAFAQSTTLYGIIDVGYQHASNYGGENKNFVSQGQHSPSRFGVRGSEDLAGGMYAMYGFESNVLADVGGPMDVNRLAFVGLGSKAWGELTLGRQYTHTFHTYAVGSAHAYGTFTSMYGQSLTPTRASNSVKYSSPVFSGFSFGAIWTPSGADASTEPTGTTGTTKDNYWDFALRYTPGPFGVAYAYGKNKNESTTTGTTDFKINELSANWDNKAFGVYGNFQTGKTDNSALGNVVDLREWNISGVARFGGVHEVYGLYGRVKNKLNEDQAKTWGIVYENVLSKRTHAYIGYGKTNNDASFALAPTAYAAAPSTQLTAAVGTQAATSVKAGESPAGLQVGIVHTF